MFVCLLYGVIVAVVVVVVVVVYVCLSRTVGYLSNLSLRGRH